MELCCCRQGGGREFELSRGSLDPSMWKIRTICWQRGQIGGRRKIIPALPPPRHTANGLQRPGSLQSSPSLSQGTVSSLVFKKRKKKKKDREFWSFPWQTSDRSTDAFTVLSLGHPGRALQMHAPPNPAPLWSSICASTQRCWLWRTVSCAKGERDILWWQHFHCPPLSSTSPCAV